MKPANTADKWIRQAIAESQLVRKSFEATKVHAMNTGYYFMQARAACDTSFDDLLANYDKECSRTSAYRYMQFVESALEWAKSENPSLKDRPDQLLKAAYKVVLQSPKPFIALMRQLGEMRKFGEYDAVKYAVRKQLGTGQIEFEFDFEKACSSLDVLDHLDEPGFVFRVPEGKNEIEARRELRNKLSAVINKLDESLADVGVIET